MIEGQARLRHERGGEQQRDEDERDATHAVLLSSMRW
jgi:hypothetical protein